MIDFHLKKFEKEVQIARELKTQNIIRNCKS